MGNYRTWIGFLALLVPSAAAIVTVVCVEYKGAASIPAPDPLKEELAAVTAHHARMWDQEREGLVEGSDEWARRRAGWRERYHADIREVCQRRGRECPSWALPTTP